MVNIFTNTEEIINNENYFSDNDDMLYGKFINYSYNYDIINYDKKIYKIDDERVLFYIVYTIRNKIKIYNKKYEVINRTEHDNKLIECYIYNINDKNIEKINYEYDISNLDEIEIDDNYEYLKIIDNIIKTNKPKVEIEIENEDNSINYLNRIKTYDNEIEDVTVDSIEYIDNSLDKTYYENEYTRIVDLKNNTSEKFTGTVENLPFWIDDDFNVWTKVNLNSEGYLELIVDLENGYSPNPDAVFEFFDDFEGDSLDSTKWQEYGSSVSLSNGICTITNDAIGYYMNDVKNKIIIAKITKYESGEYGGFGLYEHFDMNEDVAFEKGFIYRLDSTNTISLLDYSDGSRSYQGIFKSIPAELSFIIDSTNVRYIYNDEELWTKSLPITEGYLKFVANNGNTLDIDYIVIRKYAENEPTVSVTKLSDTKYKIQISNNTDSPLIDYQVKIPKIDSISSKDTTLSISGEYKFIYEINVSDFLYDVNYDSIDDFGIYEDDIYPYWIEDDGGSYNIWTKISIPANGEKTIHIVKKDGYSPNGDEVFEFFDDFEGDTLDTTKWKMASSVVPSVSDSILKWYFIADNSQSIRSIKTFNNVVINARIKYDSNDSDVLYFGLAADSDDRLTDISGSIGIPDSVYYNIGSLWYNGATHNFFTPSTDWKNIELIKTDDKIFADVNGQTISVDYDDTTERHIHLSVKNTNSNGYCDYVFVRKYAENEPITSVKQISTDTWKITITNPNDEDLVDFQIKIDGTGIVSSKTDSLLITDLKFLKNYNIKITDLNESEYDYFIKVYPDNSKYIDILMNKEKDNIFILKKTNDIYDLSNNIVYGNPSNISYSFLQKYTISNNLDIKNKELYVNGYLENRNVIISNSDIELKDNTFNNLEITANNITLTNCIIDYLKLNIENIDTGQITINNSYIKKIKLVNDIKYDIKINNESIIEHLIIEKCKPDSEITITGSEIKEIDNRDEKIYINMEIGKLYNRLYLSGKLSK